MRELSLNILDLVQNSISADASLVRITVESRPKENILGVSISDNGRGMSSDVLSRVQDPFYTTRTTRKVGLGIPLFAQAATVCGGSLNMHSRPGAGTSLEAEFELDHIDRAPLGDIASTMVALIASNPEMDFVYEQKVGDMGFVFDTREIKSVLDGVPINDPTVLSWIKNYINDNTNGSLKID